MMPAHAVDYSVTFWAKLGRQQWPERYHPVICHLIDVGEVTRQVWNRIVRQRIREWVCAKLGLPDANAVGRWLAFWAAAHDIGKVSPCFQSQGTTEELGRRLGSSWFDTPMPNTPHGQITTKVLADELASTGRPWPAVPRSLSRNVAVSVGGHHGIFPTDWDRLCSPLGNERWLDARREILAELARLFGVAELPAPSDGDEGKKNIMLQHGKAALNEKFQELKFAATLYDGADCKGSGVVAENWFVANKNHRLLAHTVWARSTKPCSPSCKRNSFRPRVLPGKRGGHTLAC